MLVGFRHWNWISSWKKFLSNSFSPNVTISFFLLFHTSVSFCSRLSVTWPIKLIFSANPFHRSLSLETWEKNFNFAPTLKSRHSCFLVSNNNLWKSLMKLRFSLKFFEIFCKWLLRVSIIIKLGISSCSILISILMSFVLGFLYKMDVLSSGAWTSTKYLSDLIGKISKIFCQCNVGVGICMKIFVLTNLKVSISHKRGKKPAKIRMPSRWQENRS